MCNDEKNSHVALAEKYATDNKPGTAQFGARSRFKNVKFLIYATGHYC